MVIFKVLFGGFTVVVVFAVPEALFAPLVLGVVVGLRVVVVVLEAVVVVVGFLVVVTMTLPCGEAAADISCKIETISATMQIAAVGCKKIIIFCYVFSIYGFICVINKY